MSIRVLDRIAPLGFAVALAGVACGDSPRPMAPAPGWSERSPRVDVLEELRADLLRPRSAADGGGTATVESLRGPAVAGQPGAWRFVYRAGPLGVAAGGAVYLQVSPFWGWSEPQTEREQAPGYTTVATGAYGVELEAFVVDRHLLAVFIGRRALLHGETIEIVYGAGPPGAVADSYAEPESTFWIAVDGDGDGVRGLIVDSPSVEVLPGPPARLLLHLPSTAKPGQTVELVAAVVDRVGNGFVPAVGALELELPDGMTVTDGPSGAGVDSPAIRIGPEDEGRQVVRLRLDTGIASVVRLRGRLIHEEGDAGRALEAESNPLVVSEGGRRILWADLQNHSGLSDGSGTPARLLRYAREVAGLEVAAVTDHDHWGMRFMDREPAIWQSTLDAARRAYEPDRFVGLAGYEWTNWVHGHRHVLFFDDVPPADGGMDLLLSAVDERFDDPWELWTGLERSALRVLTFAHHSAGDPIAVDWSFAPPSGLEPVTEVVSVHGTSEAADAPGPVIRGALAGNSVRDALDHGYRLGFVGSSDGHDGHPGLAHLAGVSGGVAAILSDELTRDGVFKALVARRTYATNGPRIVVRASYAGWPIGADIDVAAASPGELGPIAGVPERTLVVRAVAPAELARIEVISRLRAGDRGAVTGESLCESGARECSLAAELPPFEAGGYLYLRILQEDGGAAWTSPFFFR